MIQLYLLFKFMKLTKIKKNLLKIFKYFITIKNYVFFLNLVKLYQFLKENLEKHLLN
jgi:hypothetical protein